MFLYHSLSNSNNFIISRDEIDFNITDDEMNYLIKNEESGVILKERIELICDFTFQNNNDAYEIACDLIREYMGGYPSEFYITYLI
jgi:hypothetical protein